MRVWAEFYIQEAYKGQLESLGSKKRIKAIITEAGNLAYDHIERKLLKLKKLREFRAKMTGD